jgi:hypothetical protein
MLFLDTLLCHFALVFTTAGLTFTAKSRAVLDMVTISVCVTSLKHSIPDFFNISYKGYSVIYLYKYSNHNFSEIHSTYLCKVPASAHLDFSS